MSAPVHVYQVFIGCKIDDAWRAITDGDQTVQYYYYYYYYYYYGTRVESEWKPGSPISYTYPDGSVAADGEVIAIEEPRRLDMTFHHRWDPETEKGGPVRMVWNVDEEDGSFERRDL